MSAAAENPTPPKIENARRTEQINIRLTPAEKQNIASLAESAKAEMSDYMRSRALKIRPKVSGQATGERRAALETLADLGRIRGLVKQIGNNLNNIARTGNRQRLVTDTDILQALKEIESLGDIYRNLLNQSRP